MGILSTIYFGQEITERQRAQRQARKERRRSSHDSPIYVDVQTPEPARLTWAVDVILEQGEEIQTLRRRIETLENRP